MNDFDKKIIEKRVRQDNIRWIVKEVWLGIIVGIILIIVCVR